MEPIDALERINCCSVMDRFRNKSSGLYIEMLPEDGEVRKALKNLTGEYLSKIRLDLILCWIPSPTTYPEYANVLLPSR